ncbi:MAG: flavin reductase family protein [Oscillospiraceae bacterium]|nr:flavin reductase family protein [Oscillospiraceae bacterium]
MALKQVNPEQLGFNPFEAIGKQWFLLTAGTQQTGWNTMTCSWGAAGVLWNKPSVTCYVRHSRYTLGFMEQQDMFTLSFLGDEHRKALAFCGSHSGRDCDKAAESGLHPVALDGAVTFEEAKLVLVCKKRYAADMDIADIPEDAKTSFYGDNDAHRLYIGEIVACYQQD